MLCSIRRKESAVYSREAPPTGSQETGHRYGLCAAISAADDRGDRLARRRAQLGSARWPWRPRRSDERNEAGRCSRKTQLPLRLELDACTRARRRCEVAPDAETGIATRCIAMTSFSRRRGCLSRYSTVRGAEDGVDEFRDFSGGAVGAFERSPAHRQTVRLQYSTAARAAAFCPFLRRFDPTIALGASQLVCGTSPVREGAGRTLLMAHAVRQCVAAGRGGHGGCVVDRSVASPCRSGASADGASWASHHIAGAPRRYRRSSRSCGAAARAGRDVRQRLPRVCSG